MDVALFGRPLGRGFLLAALLLVATLTRLYHFQVPLLDQMYVKQVYVANKARNIAHTPLNPLRSTLDFLDESGQPMALTEEVPLYTGLLGASYRIFGEREWLGRAWSLAGTLVAIVALRGLFRREFDEESGLVAAFLFAMTPLLIFYGRAVLPDPWMLAFMLLCALAYRRYLDEGESLRWLTAAAVAGLIAGMFKYYGLMIVIPLADMAYRRGGWRAWFSPRFLALGAAMTVPIALWIVAVFVKTPNPTTRTAYFFWQVPEYLIYHRFYERLTLGLLVKDSGPVLAVLLALGVLGTLSGRERSRPLWGWSAMGLLFFFLFAPKLMDHDYYELMILPATAGWGMLGWRVTARLLSRRPGAALRGSVTLVVLVAVIHSPWVMGAKYEQEVGHLVVAERLNRLCPPGSRVVVLGQQIGWPEIHYSGRQGWVEQCITLPTNWLDTFRKHRASGAEYVAVYFDPTVPDKVRATYTPLLTTLPVVEHESGPWFRRRKPCEYYILSLRDLVPSSSPQAGIARAPVEQK